MNAARARARVCITAVRAYAVHRQVEETCMHAAHAGVKRRRAVASATQPVVTVRGR